MSKEITLPADDHQQERIKSILIQKYIKNIIINHN